jgi:hypothetical protein
LYWSRSDPFTGHGGALTLTPRSLGELSDTIRLTDCCGFLWYFQVMHWYRVFYIGTLEKLYGWHKVQSIMHVSFSFCFCFSSHWLLVLQMVVDMVEVMVMWVLIVKVTPFMSISVFWCIRSMRIFGPFLYFIRLPYGHRFCLISVFSEADYNRKRHRDDDRHGHETSKRTSDNESRRSSDHESRPVISKWHF